MARWPWQVEAPASGLHDARGVAARAVREFCQERAVDAALMAEHVEAMRYSSAPAEQFLCVEAGHGLEALCWTGGNIIPLGFDAAGLADLAEALRARHRRFSSVVGPADQVLGLWEHLSGRLHAREVRAAQPSMVIDHPPQVAPDPLVQPTSRAHADVLLPASVAMFTEEVGYSPLTMGGGYERRVRSLVSLGRSLSRIEEGPDGPEVIFKADLGTVGLGVTQIQGVWVTPSRRGQGLAAPAMAAVVEYALRHVAPVVSLYVNSFNAPALAAYRRVGFRQEGTFATVLL